MSDPDAPWTIPVEPGDVVTVSHGDELHTGTVMSVTDDAAVVMLPSGLDVQAPWESIEINAAHVGRMLAELTTTGTAEHLAEQTDPFPAALVLLQSAEAFIGRGLAELGRHDDDDLLDDVLATVGGWRDELLRRRG